ncbi:MAG: DMT family transporter [Anaerolineales bacterium]|nr:DMT family transporter [Anaerolineales bacterium]
MFSACWALQVFVAKLGFMAGAGVLPFQALSAVTVLAVFGVLLLPRVGADLARLFKRQPGLFWKLFFANGIQAGLGTCLSLIGIALTDAINAGFLVKLATVSTTFFAWIILHERLTPLKVATVFVMLFGAYLLTTKGQALLPRSGDLFILCACVCWSLGNVLVRKFLKTRPLGADVVSLQKPFAGFPVLLALIATSIFTPSALGGLDQLLGCCAFTRTDLLFALGSGFCLAMAWIYLNRTLKVATASYMTLMSMVTPVIVSLLAMLFLGETLVWVQVAGAGMILLSGAAIYVSDIAYA